MQEWGRLVSRHGAAMVQIRSRRGFLETLAGRDPFIAAVSEAWRRPIRELLTHYEKPDTALRRLMLCNIHFDPFEILDLMKMSRTLDHSLDFLSRVYKADLQAI